MEASDSLDTIAEIAITLAGFSGLAAALRTRRFHAWVPRERFTFWMIFVFSLGALFFALIPSILHYFGLSDDAVWRSASVSMFVYITGTLLGTLVANQRMDRAGHPRALPGLWVVALIVAASIAVLQCLNASGVIMRPGPGPYYVSVVALVGLGLMDFIGFLVFPERQS